MTMNVLELIGNALADPLAVARGHARAGQRVVGLVGDDLPVELVVAAGSFMLQVPAIPDQPTPDADRYLEPMFAPRHRSIAQQWLSDELGFLDTMVLSRSDDSAQRLYYYLCELQRRGVASGPRVLLYDIAKIPRPISLQHTLSATRRLAQELGADSAGFAAAITQRNRRRVLFETIDEIRRSPTPPLGSTVARLVRASDVCVADEFDDAVTRWLQHPPPAFNGTRLLLAGSAPPDERLHVAVEAAGGCIVGEAGDHSLNRLGAAVPVRDDAMLALATHYQTLRYGPRCFADRASSIAEQAALCGADGVIFWIIEEDESMVWDVPAIAETLRMRAIPWLNLTRRRWNATDDTLQRIAAFVAAQRNRS